MPPLSNRQSARGPARPVKSPYDSWSDRQKQDFELFQRHLQTVLTIYQVLGLDPSRELTESDEASIRATVRLLLRVGKIVDQETRKSL